MVFHVLQNEEMLCLVYFIVCWFVFCLFKFMLKYVYNYYVKRCWELLRKT